MDFFDPNDFTKEKIDLDKKAIFPLHKCKGFYPLHYRMVGCPECNRGLLDTGRKFKDPYWGDLRIVNCGKCRLSYRQEEVY